MMEVEGKRGWDKKKMKTGGNVGLTSQAGRADVRKGRKEGRRGGRTRRQEGREWGKRGHKAERADRLMVPGVVARGRRQGKSGVGEGGKAQLWGRVSRGPVQLAPTNNHRLLLPLVRESPSISMPRGLRVRAPPGILVPPFPPT